MAKKKSGEPSGPATDAENLNTTSEGDGAGLLPLVDLGGEAADTLPAPRTPAKAKPAAKTPGARACHENDRAADGLKRFKIRAIEHNVRGQYLYVLAPDRATAEACYEKDVGLDKLPKDKRPALNVTELPD